MNRNVPHWIIFGVAAAAWGFFGNPLYLPRALSDRPGMAFLSEIIFWIIVGGVTSWLIIRSDSRQPAPHLPLAVPVVLSLSAFLALYVCRMPYALAAELIMSFQPTALAVHFAIILVLLTAGVWRLRRMIVDELKFLFAGIILASMALFFALSVAPRTHRIYYDEDIYTQIGQAIAYDGIGGAVDCALPSDDSPWHGAAYSLNKEPLGYPLLIAIRERLAGPSHDSGLAVTLASFFFSVFGMGVLMRQLSLLLGREPVVIPLLASAAYGFWPDNLRWAATSAVEPVTAALVIWAMAFALLFSRTFVNFAGYLAIALGCYGSMTRPEALLYLVPVLLTVWPASSRLDNSRAFRAACAALTAMLLWHHVAFLYHVRELDWGASGPKFSLQFVRENLIDNLGFFFFSRVRNTVEPPPLVGPFLFIGIIAALIIFFRRNGRPRSALAGALMAWFTISVGIFIPFYAGSYFYGADIRFSLLALPPTIALVVFGMDITVRFALRFTILRSRPGAFMRIAGTLVPVLLFLSLWPSAVTKVGVIGEEAWQAREDHSAAEQLSMRLPENAVVVSHISSIWTNRGFGAAATNWARLNAEKMNEIMKEFPVYYYWGFWDNSFRRRLPPEQLTDGESFLNEYSISETDIVIGSDRSQFRLMRCQVLTFSH